MDKSKKGYIKKIMEWNKAIKMNKELRKLRFIIVGDSSKQSNVYE